MAAEEDVGEPGEPAPEDQVARRRVLRSGQVGGTLVSFLQRPGRGRIDRPSNRHRATSKTWHPRARATVRNRSATAFKSRHETTQGAASDLDNGNLTGDNTRRCL